MGEIRNVQVTNAQDVAFMKRFDADNDGRIAGDEVKAMLKSAEIGADSNGKLSYKQQNALDEHSPFQDKNLTFMVNWASDEPNNVTFDLPGAKPIKADAHFDQVGIALNSSGWSTGANADGYSHRFSIQNSAGEKIDISFNAGEPAKHADGSAPGVWEVGGVDPQTVKNLSFSFASKVGDTFTPDAKEMEALAGELEAVVASNSGKVTGDQQIALDYAALVAKTIRMQLAGK